MSCAVPEEVGCGSNTPMRGHWKSFRLDFRKVKQKKMSYGAHVDRGYLKHMFSTIILSDVSVSWDRYIRT